MSKFFGSVQGEINYWRDRAHVAEAALLEIVGAVGSPSKTHEALANARGLLEGIRNDQAGY